MRKIAIVFLAAIFSTNASAQFNTNRYSPYNPYGAPSASDMNQGMFEYQQQRQSQEQMEEQERRLELQRERHHREYMDELRGRKCGSVFCYED